tara:strand:+ start:3279 stop:3617 length:339 start_codon:yes stop_codon:yes gene_type:complete
MEYFDFTITDGVGKYTSLDKEYNTFLRRTMENIDEDNLNRWEVYNVIIDELIKIGHNNIFQEIKYRVTDGEDVNIVILDAITNDITNSSSLLWFMEKRIKGYIDGDFYNQFY